MKKSIFTALVTTATMASCSSDLDEYVYTNDKENQPVLLSAGMIGCNDSHEYVDLGLSVKWATCNVGANRPEECGDYFAWGETEPYYLEGMSHEDEDCLFKRSPIGYVWESYKYQTPGQASYEHCTKYTRADDQTDCVWYSNGKYVGTTVDGTTYKNLTRLLAEDDVVSVNWGGSWRMPTDEEQNELKNNCYWEWTTNYKGTGMLGFIVYKVKDNSDKGKVHGTYYPKDPKDSYTTDDAHIFLPAAGFRYNTFYAPIETGCYWSSDLSEISDQANGLFFSSEGFRDGKFAYLYDYKLYERCNGFSVRPVCK